MRLSVLLFLLCQTVVTSQNYVEYLTGNPNDEVVAPQRGICLMGGASENDNAMVWFLNKANGGDVVVLRASGSDGYNDYMYSQLGVTLNSVRTFVIDNSNGAVNPYVLDKVSKAEAIWFAGGDQFNYIQYFKDNAMEQVLNEFVNSKGGAIGGTSAGMAILGSSYFSAENGTVTNQQALDNPYDSRVSLGYNDFLELPYLENVITDTHYDDPDRSGRHSVFLARYAQDNDSRAFGIACNEYTAVCIDSDGKAYIYGDYPNYDEFAFFLQSNCEDVYLPEICMPNSPLTWNRNNEAIKVFKVPGIQTGENYFNLTNWQTGSGGQWERWYVENGQFFSASDENPNCADALTLPESSITDVRVFPNPFKSRLNISSNMEEIKGELYDMNGLMLKSIENMDSIDTSQWASGVYFLKVRVGSRSEIFKLLKH